MINNALMIQGTSSDAGKSLFVTGLCRILSRRGIRVAPFKPQNMALNSAVTIDGGEIGRAQALQAFAAGIDPVTDMNPILLKPISDVGSQVIVNGIAVGVMDAKSYHAYKPKVKIEAIQAFNRLADQYDAVVVEGAGSPVEINLRAHDIANMGFAEAVDLPVWLVADIERGGVFAQIVGTMELLSEPEKKRITGVVINRFRGDISLLTSGTKWLADKQKLPMIGVMPYLKKLKLDAEDSLSRREAEHETGLLHVTVPVFPKISNDTDFEPLVDHPSVNVSFVKSGDEWPKSDFVILPGSKNVIADIDWLREENFDIEILRHLRYGGKVLGLCGGYQMLGKRIDDPERIEGNKESAAGLGLLDMTTTLYPEKHLANVTGRLTFNDAPVTGYEIHAGISEGPALKNPFCHLSTGPDGAISVDGQVAGTYLHGIFEKAEALVAILAWAGVANPIPVDREMERLKEIDRLADAMEEYLDLSWLFKNFSCSGTPK